MTRDFFRKLTYQRCAIVLTGLCVAALYALAAGRHLPAEAPQTIRSADKAARMSRSVAFEPFQVAMMGSADKLLSLIDYRLDAVRKHGTVPRVFLASLPRKLPQIQVAKQRKVMFIKTTLPLILHVNEIIQHDRAEIERLAEKQGDGEALSEAEQTWLDEKAKAYGLETVDFEPLLKRVDTIPPSLAIAQSAQESGWGTSRFAHEGNALFGQRTFHPLKKGIVPKEREEGQVYKVRVFDQLIDAVKSYARNLNTHPAYKAFRALRATLRSNGNTLDGLTLAGTLTSYSERGEAYVKALQALIRYNNLHHYDKVRLGERVSIGESRPDA